VTAFNQPLKQWNVANVTTTQEMFRYASSFNQPLEQWNVANVETMKKMFYGASSFDQPLEQWNVANVTTVGGMFRGATAFNQPLEQWNVANVTTMERMFSDASSFNQPLEQWNVANVTTVNGMFLGASAFRKSADEFTQPLWVPSEDNDDDYRDFVDHGVGNGQIGMGIKLVLNLENYVAAKRFNALVIGEHIRADRNKTDGSVTGIAYGMVARALTSPGLAREIEALLSSVTHHSCTWTSTATGLPN
jgi:surface protein